ncbi:unnamed protein product [Periconia digitata]|uniref:Uncharacterized protein n=1 Tax=Periconia digitata TaxID=1303443 RepID=A0A9W4UHD9_9PLEO|nr:unnamed protein product [Periconia digitata]
MNFHFLIITAVIVGSTNAVLGTAGTSKPTPTQVERRADTTEIINLTTFTFRPIDSYLVKKDGHPDPEKDAFQMYPLGIYDDFPREGVTIALGSDLKKRVMDTMGDGCKADPQACRNKLIPIIHNTDVGAHTTRFVLIPSAFLVAAIVRTTAQVLVAATVAGITYEMAHNLKFEYEDLHQMDTLGDPDVMAVKFGMESSPTTITVSKMPSTPEPTGSGEITFETLTADDSDRKKGDLVFHIPADAARQIQDYLRVIDIQQVINICKGHDLFSPQDVGVHRQFGSVVNNIQFCLDSVSQFIPRLINGVPQSAVKFSQENLPLFHGPGQAIDYPLPAISKSDGAIIIPIYHRIVAHMSLVKNLQDDILLNLKIDATLLSMTALGVWLLFHATQNGGRIALDIRVPLSAYSRTITEENFKCPKDILCINKRCAAQVDGQPIPKRNAVCKLEQIKGCPCRRVHYLQPTLTELDWWNSQYTWMQELIKKSNMPQFEPKCQGELQESMDSKMRFKDNMQEACRKHKDIRSGYTIVNRDGTKFWEEAFTMDGMTWTFDFKASPGDRVDTCSFDCETVFTAFADIADCVMPQGVKKTGEIETDCGLFFYSANKHGGD